MASFRRDGRTTQQHLQLGEITMKSILFLTIILFSGVAEARHSHRHNRDIVYLQPGECLSIRGQTVCAAQQPAFSQPVQVEPTTVEQIFAYCSLGRFDKSTSLNVWGLFQSTTTNKGTIRKTMLKSFPHFEGSKCEAEASRMNG